MEDPYNSAEKKKDANPPGVALLSCELCSKRKIRCDKRQPCGACSKAGKECTPVVRPRLPRGRRGGRKEANTELRLRVKKLEELVSSLSSTNNSSATHDIAKLVLHDKPDSPATSTSSPGNSNSKSHSSSGDTDISRLLGSTVWTQLSNELNGLRHVLESRDDEDEIDNSPPDLASQEDSAAIDLPLQSDDYKEDPSEFLSSQNIRQYLNIYKRHVDPVFKIFHLPTFERSAGNGDPYLGFPVRSSTFRFLRAAAFYTTVCSCNEEECLAYFGEQKEVISNQWRAIMERNFQIIGMANNHSIVYLQGLVLYVSAIRTHNNGPQSWTLMGLASRIAIALQLHREESYATLTFYQGQIYRRAWFSLLALDYQAASDRGSDSCIPSNGYNTKCLEDINDADFGPGTTEPPSRKHEFTDTTFTVIASEAQYLLRELNFVPVRDNDAPPRPIQQSWEVRQEAVRRLDAYLTQQFLSKCDLTQDIQYAAFCLGKIIISGLWLSVVRPLQRHPAMTPPPPGAVNILLSATETLELKRTFSNETTHCWHWMFESYVNWHSLAVVLAELCSSSLQNTELVERAWRTAESNFEYVAVKVAEGANGGLWKPIRKLMRMARRRRAMHQAQMQAATSQAQAYQPNTQQQQQQQQQQELPMTSTTTAMSTNLDLFASMVSTTPASIPTDSLTDGEPASTLPMDYDLSMGQMDDSWMNWQGFVDDLAQNSYIGWTMNMGVGSWPAM
ncbi:hypothetical protein AAFC00_006042 [Neodothiora populina]|uniref:Zn(2)-C6 fungal-type domain-containing protein n=1 Tax=Neodothiora populina TaxID=2781224 RepID=A0ABR3P6V0_9PEZI